VPCALRRSWAGSYSGDRHMQTGRKRQAGDAEAKLTRLYEAIGNRLAELDDPNLKGRIAESAWP
jgi:hypothetical protein